MQPQYCGIYHNIGEHVGACHTAWPQQNTDTPCQATFRQHVTQRADVQGGRCQRTCRRCRCTYHPSCKRSNRHIAPPACVHQASNAWLDEAPASSENAARFLLQETTGRSTQQGALGLEDEHPFVNIHGNTQCSAERDEPAK